MGRSQVSFPIKPVIHKRTGAPMYARLFCLWCPACGEYHVDREEWATRAHKTHRCEHCGHEWEPFGFHTLGVPPFELDDRLMDLRMRAGKAAKRLALRLARALGLPV